MKDPLVKDNHLILKGISSASLFNSDPVVREKSRRQREYPGRMQREAENRVAQFHLEFPI